MPEENFDDRCALRHAAVGVLEALVCQPLRGWGVSRQSREQRRLFMFGCVLRFVSNAVANLSHRDHWDHQGTQKAQQQQSFPESMADLQPTQRSRSFEHNTHIAQQDAAQRAAEKYDTRRRAHQSTRAYR